MHACMVLCLYTDVIIKYTYIDGNCFFSGYAQIQSITLFVTHYPSLAELADEFPDTTTNGYMNYIEDDDDGKNIIWIG